MTFQSLEYLIFFPVVFLLYWMVCRNSKERQNGLIVASSLVVELAIPRTIADHGIVYLLCRVVLGQD